MPLTVVLIALVALPPLLYVASYCWNTGKFNALRDTIRRHRRGKKAP